jgi:hypothetical protein
MSNTIPQSVMDQINKMFPDATGWNESRSFPKAMREAAIWGAFELDKWIELKEGCEMPDYDEPVLWLFEDGNMQVIELDKDGNPWLYESEKDGFKFAKATHYQYLPKPPKDI